MLLIMINQVVNALQTTNKTLSVWKKPRSTRCRNNTLNKTKWKLNYAFHIKSFEYDDEKSFVPASRDKTQENQKNWVKLDSLY